MPQLLLYAVVGTAEAVMNAHGRLALASAAPALENAGIIATMLAAAAIYGTGGALADPGSGALYLLGIGTTASVAVHAAVQWWGAHRAGVRLLPGRGWRHPELRLIGRRARPSLGYSALDVLLPFGAIVVANRIPGGVIAFEFAWLCCILVSALVARPVAVSLLPRLSRLFQAGDHQRFRDDLVRGAALVAFLTVPAAVAVTVLADPIARAVTFGQMATGQGQSLIAPALASLGVGIIGYAALLVGTYACYARGDARTPFRAAVLRTGIAAIGMTLAFLVPAGAPALFALGLAITVAELAGGLALAAALRRVLPRRGEALLRPVLHSVAAAALMAVPAYLVALRLPPGVASQLAMAAAAVSGLGVYLAVQWLWRAPELALLQRGLRRNPGQAAPGPGAPA
jgi:putative peptidoglycan lipid II flippase